MELQLKNKVTNTKIMEFLKMVEYKKDIRNLPKPTMLHISTRSAISSFSSIVNLFDIFIILSKNILKNIVLKEDEDYLIKGICMSNYRLNTLNNKKKKKPNNITLENMDTILNDLKKNTRGHFYNQCSLKIKPDKYKRPVTIKLFTNGSMSMTGCLFKNDGLEAVNVLLKELNKYSGIFVDDEVEIEKYKITMINSDFKLLFKIDRYKLHDKLVNIGLLSNYDPENYPGVKIYYFWNKYDGIRNEGICRCKKKCKGKGDGTGDGQCKKVTIAIFSSGSVIITGANNEQQIIDVYKQINKYIKLFYTDIINFSITDFINS